MAASGREPAAHASSPGTLTLHVPLKFRHLPGQTTIILPDDAGGAVYVSTAGARRMKAEARRARPDATLIRALVRAHRWAALLNDGTHATISDLATAEKVGKSYVSRVLRLTLLAPDITRAILDGHQPHTLDLKTALRPFPWEWSAQRQRFGMR
ncbi:hypothetical protein F1654_07210 [Alkalicaulis satelles]|uniref:LacI family transcriptional regulator n=1 Tax=Alkalicaulis satelles TaxID=2609175 RepID=A0A5M6ZID8_9PROT|nr:hypothetical protein [Alkalicaulis satelles]KAA5803584.1 hypothetical protein F1654_07210 [Alkalicaulis satelles]